MWKANKTSKGWTIESPTALVANVPFGDASAQRDALLIAAAPDMYKLLKSIQQSRTFSPSDFDLIDIAIKKAEGRE